MVKENFYNLVKVMREAQRLYTKTRLKKDRDIAFSHERKVDIIINKPLKRQFPDNFPIIEVEGINIYVQKIIEVDKQNNYSELFMQMGYSVISTNEYNTNRYRLYKAGLCVGVLNNSTMKSFLNELGYKLIINQNK